MPSANFLRRRSISHLLRLATRWFAFRHSLSLSLYISWSCNRAGNYTATSQAMQQRLVFVFNIFVRPEPFFRRAITKHSDLEPPILQHCVLRQIFFSPFHPLVQLPCDEWVVESYFNNVRYNFFPSSSRARCYWFDLQQAKLNFRDNDGKGKCLQSHLRKFDSFASWIWLWKNFALVGIFDAHIAIGMPFNELSPRRICADA